MRNFLQSFPPYYENSSHTNKNNELLDNSNISPILLMARNQSFLRIGTVNAINYTLIRFKWFSSLDRRSLALPSSRYLEELCISVHCTTRQRK